MRLIPALDLRGGAVVRLERGEFGRERRYPVEPAAWIDGLHAAGAGLVHVVDLDGARDGDGGNRETVRGLLGRGVGVQVAGGIRTLARALEWLELGATRVVIGSAALERPDEVERWLAALGAERVVLAFDVRCAGSGERLVASHGWRRDSGWRLEQAVDGFRRAGLRHVLATAIERDGTLDGPDLELYRDAARWAGDVQWQASGGVRDVADLAALAATGAAAAVVGRALLEGRIDGREIGRWSRDASSPAST